jgi:hypothetical protein
MAKGHKSSGKLKQHCYDFVNDTYSLPSFFLRIRCGSDCPPFKREQHWPSESTAKAFSDFRCYVGCLRDQPEREPLSVFADIDAGRARRNAGEYATSFNRGDPFESAVVCRVNVTETIDKSVEVRARVSLPGIDDESEKT